MKDIEVVALTSRGERMAALDELARLRIVVFREWPYLYDGTLDYERSYLAHFVEDERAILVVARSGGKVIGAATASPMSSQDKAFIEPVRAVGLEIDKLCFFGESVLLPEFRGCGIGHAFFDHRERQARELGASAACFCAVVRPAAHPLRPHDARDLSAFWRKRGYRPIDGALGHYDWKDIDQPTESRHPMQFWLRDL